MMEEKRRAEAKKNAEAKNCAEAEKAGGCCRKRAVPRSAEERTRLVNRLNRIEGQIRGIRGMVENDLYCNDILVQCSAVNAALNAFERELLASHVRSCVADDLRAGKDEVVDELLETLKKMMK